MIAWENEVIGLESQEYDAIFDIIPLAIIKSITNDDKFLNPLQVYIFFCIASWNNIFSKKKMPEVEAQIMN